MSAKMHRFSSFNKIAITAAILFIALLIIWPIQQPRPIDSGTSLLTTEFLGNGDEYFYPLPEHLALNPQRVALGEKLFHDTRISGNGFSCASCHSLATAGADRLERSITTSGKFDNMNTPTLFNAAFNSLQTWRGHLPDLSSQLDEVINNPKHFASNWEHVVNAIRKNEDLNKDFKRVFRAEVNRSNVTRALVSFQQSLFTPDSKFDRFLRGDVSALSVKQQQGYQLFIDYGCVSCHQGVNLGGNLRARFGIYKDGFTDKSKTSDFDYGLYSLTGKESDKYIFRVPGLRNVAVTAPYFHNGSASTLSQAISTMARIQLNLELPEDDISRIADFLQSLTGTYRGKKL